MDNNEQTHDIEQPNLLAHHCADLMVAKKAQNIVILDVRGLTDVTDYLVVGSADNDTHLKAIGDGILDGLSKEGVKPYRTEGWQGLQWVILDFVEVVVHLFYREARDFYKLERLWADAPVENIHDDISVSGSSAE